MLEFREERLVDGRDKTVSKRWKRMSSAERKKIISKVWIFLFCLALLSYHAYLLFMQYFNGKTSVSIRVERIKPESLPAVTVCYPYALRMDAMAERFPALRQNYSRYLDIITKVTADDYQNETLKKHLIDIYENSIQYYRRQNMSVNVLFDSNLTLPFNITAAEEKYFYRNTTKQSITMKYRAIEADDSFEEHQDVDPMVSFINHLKGIQKCYTFFSERSVRWRRIQTNINVLFFEMKHGMHWFAPNIYDKYYDFGANKIYFSVHSPNVMPFAFHSDNFLKLNMDYNYHIHYTIVQNKLLPAPYDTNCYRYDVDSHYLYDKSRGDCLFACYEDSIRQNDWCANGPCVGCSLLTTNFIRKYVLISETGRACNVGVNLNKTYIVDDKCMTDCRRHCNYNDYILDIKDNTKHIDKSPWKKVMYVELIHNLMADQTVEHSPAMTYVEVFSNFGGLMGIWLGISVMVIIDAFVAFFRNFY